tara:strand:- start:19658 stop:19903 length:246 start_codon:yes stop_codon:yes gene_type:complete
MNTFLIVFALFILFIFIWDIYLIRSQGKKASISANVIRISHKYPSIVFVFAFSLGFVMGHLFWNMDDSEIFNIKCEEVKVD